VRKSTDPTRLRLSRKEVRHDPDARAHRRPHDAAMVETTSYAVAWTEAGSRFVGHALLAERGLRLEGRDASAHEGLRSIRFDEIVALELRRANGHRTLVVEVAGDDELRIASLDRPGSLGELAERLRVLTDSPQR
jgi:hypothetical protein